jgi:hypothetical protein
MSALQKRTSDFNVFVAVDMKFGLIASEPRPYLNGPKATDPSLQRCTLGDLRMEPAS